VATNYYAAALADPRDWAEQLRLPVKIVSEVLDNASEARHDYAPVRLAHPLDGGEPPRFSRTVDLSLLASRLSRVVPRMVCR
jgi:hypothetical protein